MNVLIRLVRFALLLLVIAAGVVTAQDVAEQSKRELIRRLVNEVYTGQSLDLLATAFTPDFLWITAGDQSQPLAGWRADVQALNAALPDLHTRTLQLLTSGDWAASLVQLNGTFDAPLDWRGTHFSPNGADVAWLQYDILQFGDDGRAVQGYSERDTFGLLAQLGASASGPQPVQPAQASVAASGQGVQPAQPNAPAAAFTREDEDRFQAALAGFLDSALANNDAAQLVSFFSDDVRVHFPAGDATPDSLRQWLVSIRQALPDVALETPVLLVDDDYAAARLQMSGVFFGQWTEPSGAIIPANDQFLTLTANLLARFNRDGKIAELWLVYDRGDWLTRLAATAPVQPALGG